MGREKLRSAGISSWKTDASYLLRESAGLSEIMMLIEPDTAVAKGAADMFFEYIERRENHEPAAYILGKKEFMGMMFSVGSGVLIPRPDTEILVEEAVKIIKNNDIADVIDMCAGSGCIAISLAKLCGIKVLAVDSGDAVMPYLLDNIERHEVSEHVNVMKSDLFERVGTEAVGLIVSNPPYIDGHDMQELDREVGFEPMPALYGGIDGLDYYRRITAEAVKRLDGGFLAFEIGYNQACDVSEIMKAHGFCDIKIIKDYSGLDRVLLGRYMNVR